jgi:hypothetical protein
MRPRRLLAVTVVVVGGDGAMTDRTLLAAAIAAVCRALTP